MMDQGTRLISFTTAFIATLAFIEVQLFPNKQLRTMTYFPLFDLLVRVHSSYKAYFGFCVVIMKQFDWSVLCCNQSLTHWGKKMCLWKLPKLTQLSWHDWNHQVNFHPSKIAKKSEVPRYRQNAFGYKFILPVRQYAICSQQTKFWKNVNRKYLAYLIWVMSSAILSRNDGWMTYLTLGKHAECFISGRVDHVIDRKSVRISGSVCLTPFQSHSRNWRWEVDG